jgi:hypothetical protein
MGQGDTLRKFSKPRFWLHAVGIPLLGYSITEIATVHGIYDPSSCTTTSASVSSGSAIQNMLLAYAFYESLNWSRYDINDLQLVDLRASTQHQGNYMSGTLAYTVTSGKKKLELVIPVVLLVLYELVIGILLIWQDSSNGSMIYISGVGLVSSSTITLLTASIRSRPDIQLFGENFHNSMICAVLALI